MIVTLAPPWVFAGLLISHGRDVRWMDLMRRLVEFSFNLMTSHRLGCSTPCIYLVVIYRGLGAPVPGVMVVRGCLAGCVKVVVVSTV